MAIYNEDNQETNQEPNQEPAGDNDSMEKIIAARVEAATMGLKKEINGLNRKNSELDANLREAGNSKSTVEDRLAQLEEERLASRKHTAELEAFGEAKLDVEWLKPFNTDDPYERATLLKELLADNERKVATDLGRQLGGRAPIQNRRTPDKESFTTEDLRGLSSDEINRLWAEGKVR